MKIEIGKSTNFLQCYSETRHNSEIKYSNLKEEICIDPNLKYLFYSKKFFFPSVEKNTNIQEFVLRKSNSEITLKREK